MTISKDDNEVSKRKKTERNHVATLQHPVLGQDPVHSRWGGNHQLLQNGEGAETRVAELFNGKFSDTAPSFKNEKVIAKLQPQGRSSIFSQALA